jgi:L-ascorbate metabolism protein UlaG (beta-lactamase superfamily)
MWAIKDIPAQLGAAPTTGARGDRVRRSPQFHDGKFHNSVPTTTVPAGEGGKILSELLRGVEHRKPSQPIPVVHPPATAAPDTEGALFITWYGHASALVEIEGRAVLLDPMWSDRASLSPLVGPHRLHPPPLSLDELPEIDAVVISHDHYDHLDMPTIKALAERFSAPFLVPLGVGAHLERWGVRPARIIELDWDQSATASGVRFTVTGARHFSGRGFVRDQTLWGSWVIAGPTRRVFYSGDGGYFDGFARIGAEHGPFDATLIQVGAYAPYWPDIHMTPEDGVTAHLDVKGGVLIPVHWCTFTLSFHPWSEPVDRLWREAKERGVTLAVPRPGERIDIDSPPEVGGWWQTVA